jgi:hypothetical protein
MAEQQKKQDKVRYTQAQKEAIAKIFSQTLAYEKTERSKEAKMLTVESQVAAHEAFRDLEHKSKAAALDKEFRRMTKELLLKSGMSKEGANVSALSNVPSDHEQLLMDMAEENHNAKVAKDNEKEKKRKVAQALFGHEQDGLANQGVINTCTNNLQCKDVDEYENDDFMHTPGDSLATTATSSGDSSTTVSSTTDPLRGRPKKKLHANEVSKFEKTIIDLISGASGGYDELIHEEHRLSIQERKLAVEERSATLALIAQLTTSLTRILDRQVVPHAPSAEVSAVPFHPSVPNIPSVPAVSNVDTTLLTSPSRTVETYEILL